MNIIQNYKNSNALLIGSVLCAGAFLHGMQQGSSSSQGNRPSQNAIGVHGICLARDIGVKELSPFVNVMFEKTASMQRDKMRVR